MQRSDIKRKARGIAAVKGKKSAGKKADEKTQKPQNQEPEPTTAPESEQTDDV